MDDLTTNYLVYDPLVYDQPDDNMVLDVELYSEGVPGRPDFYLMDEMVLHRIRPCGSRSRITVLTSMRKTAARK